MGEMSALLQRTRREGQMETLHAMQRGLRLRSNYLRWVARTEPFGFLELHHLKLDQAQLAAVARYLEWYLGSKGLVGAEGTAPGAPPGTAPPALGVEHKTTLAVGQSTCGPG